MAKAKCSEVQTEYEFPLTVGQQFSCHKTSYLIIPVSDTMQVSGPQSAVYKEASLRRVIVAVNALSTLRKVAGGTVLSLIGAVIAAWLLEIGWVWAKVWTGILSGASWGWRLIQSSYVIPGWVVLLLGLLALFGMICVAFYVVLPALRPVRKESQPFLSYTEDMIDGVKWRWIWSRLPGVNQYDIDNLWCFCPNCDAQLVVARGTGPERETLLICERCPSDPSDSTVYNFRPRQGLNGGGKVKATTPGITGTDSEAYIKREIRRRIRTGTYQHGLSP